jgi:uncharacterized membrane protein
MVHNILPGIVAMAGVTAVVAEKNPSAVWWIGLVLSVIGAVYTYINNNNKK